MKNIIKNFEQFVAEINENDFGFVPTKSHPIFAVNRIEEEDVKSQNIKYIQAAYIRDKEDKDEKVREENIDSDTKQNI
jgi:hypothetical protein